jgi:hypothetical protein
VLITRAAPTVDHERSADHRRDEPADLRERRTAWGLKWNGLGPSARDPQRYGKEVACPFRMPNVRW